jgi:hypothetical protein
MFNFCVSARGAGHMSGQLQMHAAAALAAVKTFVIASERLREIKIKRS